MVCKLAPAGDQGDTTGNFPARPETTFPVGDATLNFPPK
jgi:hypothetical protein